MSKPTRPTDLPDFERPPLNEVVLSIQFGVLPFRNIHAGLIWQKFAADYPSVEEQSPLEPVFETFGPLKPGMPNLGFQLGNVSEPLRYWFVSAEGNELLQVQKDRLIHNWRQRKPDDAYPRYESIREKFKNEVDRAAVFFRETNLGEISCNQCEVTYINLIAADGDATSKMDKIFSIVREPNDYLSSIERGQLTLSFVLPGDAGAEPLGRLHATMSPVLRIADGKSAWRLDLTARGRPADEKIASAFAWLDKGREAVVRSFSALTTEKMHRLWGRRA
jgi:uncharacterized protein (TIGR04255 family)